MLYIIGIGLKPKHLSLEALEVAKNCAAVFLETYTSKYSEGTIEELSKIIDRRIVQLKREQVENSELILSQANKENIALLVFGNPMTATTHIQLLIDAKKEGIKTEVIPCVSISDYLGKTGLSSYRFGRTATIVLPEENYAPESFYDQIAENKKNNLHSLCLLDIKEDGRLMSVNEALAVLEKIEKKKGNNLIKESVLVVLCGAGNRNEIIKAGNFNEIKRSGYDVFPQSLIVCAKLNEKEKEALSFLYGLKD